MSSIFSAELTQPINQIKILPEVQSTPVDNSTANTINAIGGLVKIGGDSYQVYRNNQFLKTTADTLAKNMTAVDQGKMTSAEAETRNAAFLRAQLVARPDLTGEIQTSAKAVVGTNPTEEHFKQLDHARQLEQTISDTSVASQVKAAIDAGTPILKSDGTLDTVATAKAGINIQANEYRIKQAKEAHALIPTKSDKDQADSKVMGSTLDGIIGAKYDTLLSSYNTIYEKAKGLPPQDQLNLVGREAQQFQLEIENAIRQTGIKLGASPEVQDQWRQHYAGFTKSFTDLATGELNDAKGTLATSDALKNKLGLNFTQAHPTAVAMYGALGGAGAAQAVTTIAKDKNLTSALIKENTNTVAGITPGAPILVNDHTQSNLQNYLHIITGNKDVSHLANFEKPAIANTAGSAIMAQEKEFTSLTPDQNKSFMYNVKAMSDLNNDPINQNAISKESYVDFWNRDSFRTTLDQASKKDVTKASVERIANQRAEWAKSEIETSLKLDPTIKYDPKTDTTNNKYVNSLVQNLNLFAKFAPDYSDGIIHKDILATTKKSLFNISPSSTSSGN